MQLDDDAAGAGATEPDASSDEDEDELDGLTSSTRVQDASAFQVESGASYLVYISYAEIYNECVALWHPLLCAVPSSSLFCSELRRHRKGGRAVRVCVCGGGGEG